MFLLEILLSALWPKEWTQCSDMTCLHFLWVRVFSCPFSSLLSQTFCTALFLSVGFPTPPQPHSKLVSVAPHGQEWKKSINEHFVCFTNIWLYVYLCLWRAICGTIHLAVWTSCCSWLGLPTPFLLPHLFLLPRMTPAVRPIKEQCGSRQIRCLTMYTYGLFSSYRFGYMAEESPV